MWAHTRIKHPMHGCLGGEHLAGSDPWQEAESKEQRERAKKQQQVVGGAGFITYVGKQSLLYCVPVASLLGPRTR